MQLVKRQWWFDEDKARCLYCNEELDEFSIEHSDLRYVSVKCKCGKKLWERWPIHTCGRDKISHKRLKEVVGMD